MSQFIRGFFVLLLTCASASAFAATNDAGAKVAWSYKGSTGPEFWGRLSPDFLLCGKGKSQSPINITKNDLEKANSLSLHYQSAPLFLMEDGLTTLTLGSTQTIINDGHTLQVNFHGDEESISYAGNTYHLVQFHFHSPSENEINGEAAPLEIHFVHQGANGSVAVIGVLVKGGESNPALQAIINHLPAADGKEYAIKNETINPIDFFPLDHDYYSFMGSLTTPPCTEGLQWLVMASTITATPAQIATIRHAINGPNTRAVQPLNGRLITYSMGNNG